MGLKRAGPTGGAKPIAIDEWGLGMDPTTHQILDVPSFIANIHDCLAANALYGCLFDYSYSMNNILTLALAPQSQQQFKVSFGQ